MPSRRVFKERILREARQQATSLSVDLSASIASLTVASSVTATDSFPFITSGGVGYRGTASLIRDYVLGISGGTATIPENLSVQGNTTLGDATTDTITTTGRWVSNAIPLADNVRDLGAVALRWANVYAVTFTGALVGNASTATTWQTARDFTIGATTRSVNGSANVTWTLGDLGAVPTTRELTIAGTAGRISSSAGAQDLSANRTWTLDLVTTAVTPASYGSSTSIPSFTVDAYGRLTAAAGNAVVAPAGTLTGTTLASNVVTSSLTTIGTLIAGAVPASLVTAGTFGAGAYTFPSTLAVTTSVTSASFIGPLTGNASTATTLQTTRTIWGQNFNGSANVSGAFSGATTGAFSSNVTIDGTLSVASNTYFGAFNPTDLDTIHNPNARGVAFWASPFQPSNRPAGANYFSGFTVRHGISGTYYSQLTLATAAGAIHTRYYNGTSWSTWQQVVVDDGSGNVAITNGLTVAGTLRVTGATTLSSTLTQNGTTASLAQSATTSLVNIGNGTGSGSSQLTIRGAAGQLRKVQFQSGSVRRWDIRTEANTESGSDAGSPFAIVAATDTGAFIDYALSITRAAGGTIAFSSARPITGGTYNGQTISSAASFTGTVQLAGNLILAPSANVSSIRTNTADASDTALLQITPASGAGSSRGALLALYGNEHATNPALALLETGDVSGAEWRARIRGTTWISVTRPASTNILAITGQSSFSTFVAVGGATLSSTTALITPASTTGVSSLRLPHGTAPFAPVNGDIWTTTSGLYARINGATVGPFIDSGSFGDVTGPASATDNAIVRFDGTTGKLVQNSILTLDDTGKMTLTADSTDAEFHLSGTGISGVAMMRFTTPPGVAENYSAGALGLGGFSIYNDDTPVEELRTSPPSPGETSLWLYDADNATLERVTVGAANSGGTGFKLLRIPN